MDSKPYWPELLANHFYLYRNRDQANQTSRN